MNRISKGDLILVPRKYAESVIPDYNGSFAKNMGVRTMACAAGIDKGAEDNTLLYIRELTDHFTTIAIPILEVSESDSLPSLYSAAVRKANVFIAIIKTKKNEYMEELYGEWKNDIDSSFSYEKSVDFDVYKRIEF